MNVKLNYYFLLRKQIKRILLPILLQLVLRLLVSESLNFCDCFELITVYPLNYYHYTNNDLIASLTHLPHNLSEVFVN